MKKNCILLITHNRDAFVNRFFKFYKNQMNDDVDFVIAHSGNEASKKNIQQLVSQYPALNLTLFSYDETIDFFEKVVMTLKKIPHTYVALCADDDYILPDAVAKAADFLSTHLDYISVSGYIFTIGKTLDDSAKFYCYAYPQLPVIFSDRLKRLSYHLKFYTATFYNTYRKKDLMFIFEEAAKIFAENAFNGRYMELLMAGLAIMMGKIYLLDSLYMIRQGDNLIAASTTCTTQSRIIVGTDASDIFHRYFVEKLAALFEVSPLQKKAVSHALIQYFCLIFNFRSLLKNIYDRQIGSRSCGLLLHVCLRYLFRKSYIFPVFYQEQHLEIYKNTPEFHEISQLIYKEPVPNLDVQA